MYFCKPFTCSSDSLIKFINNNAFSFKNAHCKYVLSAQYMLGKVLMWVILTDSVSLQQQETELKQRQN